MRLTLMTATLLLSLAATSRPSALDTTLGSTDLASISQIDVLRTNPWIATVVAVRPQGINSSYADRATIGTLDKSGMAAVVGALRNSVILGNRCYEASYTYDTFPVAWGVQLLDNARRELGAIYLTGSGVCAAAHGEVFGIDPSLAIFLRRYFSFMNSAAVNRARGEAISEGHRRNRSWAREHPGQRDEAWFKREITPKLDTFSLKEIGKATSLSLAACSRIRAGARVPHPRHWQALLKLLGGGEHG